MKLSLDASIKEQCLKKPFRITLDGEDVSSHCTKVEVDENGWGWVERLRLDENGRVMSGVMFDFVRYKTYGRVTVEAWDQ